MLLDRLNSDLKLKQKEISDREDDLVIINKDLIKSKEELQNNSSNLINSVRQLEMRQRSDAKKDKKYVQTTFFKPKIMRETVSDDGVNELIKIVKEIEIDSLTPVEAMKKLINLNELLSKLRLD